MLDPHALAKRGGHACTTSPSSEPDRLARRSPGSSATGTARCSSTVASSTAQRAAAMLAKPCGGLLAPAAQAELARQGLGVPASVIAGPQLFAVRTLDLPARLERLYQRFYINVDREAFDRWLVSLVPECVDGRLRLEPDGARARRRRQLPALPHRRGRLGRRSREARRRRGWGVLAGQATRVPRRAVAEQLRRNPGSVRARLGGPVLRRDLRRDAHRLLRLDGSEGRQPAGGHRVAERGRARPRRSTSSCDGSVRAASGSVPRSARSSAAIVAPDEPLPAVPRRRRRSARGRGGGLHQPELG